ncbi:Zinc finger, CCHC-type [Cucumis melo var. makuwa]|uniref:Zinc finger, CCHC-type n=1 Tax=Cucumis melo var. makuwa TaxID=1194695 RepID=A0A5A7V002_CUCMM|nr:Zinc finger, CCHC-type [Cucumis melo var. makuwa]
MIMGDLQDVVEGTEVNPPKDTATLKKWNIKASKAMFAIKTTIDEEMLEHVSIVKTPKKAWDTFASLFSKKNDARLQFLENKLLSITQREMTINQYFTKGSQVREASKNNRPHGHRKKGECYNCGKISHYAKECCRKKKIAESNAVTSQVESSSKEEWDVEACCATTDPNPQSTSNVMENEVLALHAEKVIYENDWIVGSGYFNHMTGDKRKLQNTIEYKGSRVVVTANNLKLPIAYLGKTMIMPHCNDPTLHTKLRSLLKRNNNMRHFL